MADIRWPDDPRLVAVYDVECTGRRDHDVYLQLAEELDAGIVADVGCGTGVFATDVVARGRRAIGVDPAAAMLAAAGRRPHGDRVEWIHGGAEALPTGTVDLVVMMGHVAQYFVSDDEWATALHEIHRSLRPGGHLTFEVRNPADRAWERWTEDETRRTLPHPDGGEFRSWCEVVDVRGDPSSPTETHEGHTVLPDGTRLVTTETLRFRTADEITTSLDAAGFVIRSRWGDWDRTPFTDTSPELIVIAVSP